MKDFSEVQLMLMLFNFLPFDSCCSDQSEDQGAHKYPLSHTSYSSAHLIVAPQKTKHRDTALWCMLYTPITYFVKDLIKYIYGGTEMLPWCFMVQYCIVHLASMGLTAAGLVEYAFVIRTRFYYITLSTWQ